MLWINSGCYPNYYLSEGSFSSITKQLFKSMFPDAVGNLCIVKVYPHWTTRPSGTSNLTPPTSPCQPHSCDKQFAALKDCAWLFLGTNGV